MKRATLCLAFIVPLAVLAGCAQLGAIGTCVNALGQAGVFSTTANTLANAPAQ